MKVAMDSSVLDRFEKILMGLPSVDKEQEALMEIYRSGVRFCLLPCNIEDLDKIKRPNVEKHLGKCIEERLDLQKINKRMNEVIDPDEDLEVECRLLVEAEESGVNVILTTIGNFITELGRKSNKVKIMKPTDYIRK